MKYIDAEKLLDIIIKMQKEYATQEVTEDHKGLRAVLGGQCLVLTEIIEIVDSLQQEQPEMDKFDCPVTPIEEAIEVTSRMQHIDEELKPIAKFIMDYASWNLHKDEWNQPTIEVPLFRVLDALVLKGKPYCCAG